MANPVDFSSQQGTGLVTPNPYLVAGGARGTFSQNDWATQNAGSPVFSHEVSMFNQTMITAAEHFDPFIQAYTTEFPRVWHDRIPRSAYTLGTGTNHKTNIFRGGMPHQGGLWFWEDINPRPSVNNIDSQTGNNPCKPPTPLSYSYAFESMAWSGKRAAWASDPICADYVKYIDAYAEQIGWILQTGVEFGVSLQETWNREMYVYFAVMSGRGIVMAPGATAFESDKKFCFVYDPFLRKTDPADSVSKSYVIFRADVPVSTLNFDVLDYLHMSLSMRAGAGSLASMSGRATFGLMASIRDMETFIKADPQLREDWRYATPAALIDGYSMSFTPYRGWAVSEDPAQLRFKVSHVESSTDARVGGSVSVPVQVVVAFLVPPFKEVRAGDNGVGIPGDNPDYWKAEIAIAPVLINQVFENQFVPSITSVGSGTSFGPVTGLNGQWSWRNILDKEDNPEGTIGNFYGKFEIFPKPLRYVTEATSLLYRRCTQEIATLCGLDTIVLSGGTQPTSAVAISVPAAGDIVDNGAETALAVAFTVDLAAPISVTVGTPVTFSFTTGENPAVPYTAVVIDTTMAPTYRFAITTSPLPAVTALTGADSATLSL